MPDKKDEISEQEVRDLFKKSKKQSTDKNKQVQHRVLKQARHETGFKDLLMLFALAWMAIKIPGKILSFITKSK